jgi:hypothetical protein
MPPSYSGNNTPSKHYQSVLIGATNHPADKISELIDTFQVLPDGQW